jgi:hypothetical protein
MFKSSKKPSLFFKTLYDLNNLDIWFNQIYLMVGIPQPTKYHGNNDVFDHTMEVIDTLSNFTNDPSVLFAGLFHDIGKVYTPIEILPHHYGHENIDSIIIEKVLYNLSATNDVKKKTLAAVKYHMKLARVSEMRHSKVLKMVKHLMSLNILDDVILIAHADKMRNNGLTFDDLRKIHFACFCLDEKLPEYIIDSIKNITDGNKIQQIVLNYRIKRYKELLNEVS